MKTKVKRVLAIVTAITVALTAVCVFAEKSDSDVNIAVGKSAVSAAYGTDTVFGTTVANVVDGNDAKVFITCATDRITVDLGKKYPITEAQMVKWSSETGTYGSGKSTFDVYVSNTKPASQTAALTNAVQLPQIKNGDSGFFNVKDDTYYSRYVPETVGAYRYVQLVYTKIDAIADLRIGELKVFTTKEAAEATTETAVVSKGKPVYCEGNPSWNTDITAVNDGREDTYYTLYGESHANKPLTICLMNKYPIEYVKAKFLAGDADEILVSNDVNFDNYEPLIYDETEEWWTLDESAAENEFTYVRIMPMPVQANANDTTLWVRYKEISVYSSKTYADKSINETANVSVGKYIESKVHGTQGYLSAAANAVDGDDETKFWAIVDPANEEYLTIDLGNTYPIYNVEILTEARAYTPGTGRVIVSNDKTFGTYTELSKYKKRNDNYKTDYYASGTAPGKDPECRFVRVYKDVTTSIANWQVMEISVYTDKAASELSDAMRNAVLEGEYTNKIGGLNDLIDGNRGTNAGVYGGIVKFKLPYPQSVEKIEIDMRSAGGGDDDRYGYNVWLSETGNTADGIKVMSSEAAVNAAYTDGSTIAARTNSDKKFMYVLIGGRNDGFFYIDNIRAMTKDFVDSIEYTPSLDGEKTAGSTLTFNVDYRSNTDENTPVKLIIAQYEGGKLIGCEAADAVVNGKSGTVSADYVIENLNENTVFKAMMWNGTLSAPIINTAE